jgi:hypothetical protein
MEGSKVTKEIPKQPTALLYIDRNRVYYLIEGVASPLVLDLPLDVVSDLEVINKKKFDNTIKSFVSSNNLVPTSLIFLFSTTVTFEKEFPAGGVDIDKGIEEFLEIVPFEEYISKKIETSVKTKIVAANRDLFEAFKEAFQSLNFTISTVLSLSFCLDLYPQLKSNLDLGFIIQKAPELKEFNLLTSIVTPTNTAKKPEQNKKQVYMVIVIFIVLGVLLFFMIYQNFIAPSRAVKSLPPVPTPMPAVTTEPVDAASDSAQITVAPNFSPNSTSTSGQIITGQ